jgi:amidase
MRIEGQERDLRASRTVGRAGNGRACPFGKQDMPGAPTHFSTARDMLEALARGQISAAELLELHVERCEETNPQVNAVVQMNLDAARTRAAELDRLAAHGGPRGPLHGLPITVKDTFDVLGMPATAGAPEYASRPLRTPDA